MGIYRKVYQPFGADTSYTEDTGELFVTKTGYQLDLAIGDQRPKVALQYQLDWPGIAGTAEKLGIAANQIATGAQPMDPGAGVLAPGASPEAPPTSIQAPPPGTPGVANGGTSPIVLIGGAALLYFIFVK